MQCSLRSISPPAPSPSPPAHLCKRPISGAVLDECVERNGFSGLWAMIGMIGMIGMMAMVAIIAMMAMIVVIGIIEMMTRWR